MGEDKVDKLARYTSIIDFLSLYSGVPDHVEETTCIIRQGNMKKVIWDLWILLILLAVSLIVPVRLAFVESDSDPWFMFYILTDLMFLIDIVLTFFTSIQNDK